MIPLGIKEKIDRFVEKGIPTGEFLKAVLTNNLYEAFNTSDDVESDHLYDVVMYVKNHTPPKCHGSVGNYWSWAEGGGLGRPYTKVAESEKL